MTAVRAGFSREAGIAARVVVLLGIAVVFVAAGARNLGSFGGWLFLLAGLAGTVLFAGRLVLLAGAAVSGRPVLILDEAGVRLPAPWPRSPAGDRLLPWPDVAAVVVWRPGLPRGRRAPADRLAFLPIEEAARRTGPAPSAELLALGLDGASGVPTAYWSVTLPPGADVPLEEVLAEVRRRSAARVVDARSQ